MDRTCLRGEIIMAGNSGSGDGAATCSDDHRRAAARHRPELTG
jgi:hypothetical protein